METIGIITKAKDASIAQSCAALSEYLNNEYIVGRMDELVEKNDDGTIKTAVEKLLDKYSDWFYKDGSNDYIIKECTYTDSDGNAKNGFIKIRLIRKKNLPNKIKNQLKGGNAIGNSGTEDSNDAYDQLKDVYGVTGNLQVYYCADGLSSLEGIDIAENAAIDEYDGTQIIYSKSSDLAKVIADSTGESAKDLSMQDLKTINDITISNTSGVSDLRSLKDLQNLKKLTLTNYQGSLNGIEKAYNLTLIYFNNSNGTQNINYSGFNMATKLTEIRFYNPTNVEVEKMCNAMKSTDYTKLKNIYMYGYWNNYWELFYTDAQTGYYSNAHCSFSSLKYFDNLTKTTKQTVTQLIFANCSLTTTEGIENFSNAIKIRLTNNLLKNIKGIENLKNLNWISVSNNPELESIEQLKAITTLKYAQCSYDTALTDISPLIAASEENLVYAYKSSNLDFSTSKWTANSNALINKLSNVPNVYLDSKYSLLFSNRAEIDVSSNADAVSIMELSGKTTITALSLKGNKNLTDAQLQTLLSSLPNLKNVNLDSTNLASLNWASQKTNLNRISFQGTAVTDITPLVENTRLGYIRFDDAVAAVTLYKNGDETFNNKIIKIIETSYNYYCSEYAGTVVEHGGGFIPIAQTYFDQINKLTNLTKIHIRYYNMPNYTVDFSNTKLKNLYIQFSNHRTIKVPSTIETISTTFRTYFSASSIANLKTLDGDGVALVNCSNINTKFDTIQNGVTVNFGGDVLDAFNYMNGYVGTWTGSFRWSASSGGVKYGVFNSSYLSTMTNCNSVLISCLSTERLDGKDFANYTKDFSLELNGCQVTNFNNINSATHMTSLNLTNNRIADISFFMINIGRSNIKSLDLSNNNLSNLCSYKDSNGRAVSIETSEILTKLPKLTYVNLSGNVDLTNFTALKNSGFVETAQNSKIFQKK